MNFLEKLFGTNQVVQRRGSLTSSDREQVRQGWQRIDELTKVSKPSTFREAVIEADKLVNFVLDRIYPGKESAAERLKAAREDFVNHKQGYENLWYAHKIRNEMVHTVGFELPLVEAKNILAYFKEALEILGAV